MSKVLMYDQIISIRLSCGTYVEHCYIHAATSATLLHQLTALQLSASSSNFFCFEKTGRSINDGASEYVDGHRSLVEHVRIER